MRQRSSVVHRAGRLLVRQRNLLVWHSLWHEGSTVRQNTSLWGSWGGAALFPTIVRWKYNWATSLRCILHGFVQGETVASGAGVTSDICVASRIEDFLCAVHASTILWLVHRRRRPLRGRVEMKLRWYPNIRRRIKSTGMRLGLRGMVLGGIPAQVRVRGVGDGWSSRYIVA